MCDIAPPPSPLPERLIDTPRGQQWVRMHDALNRLDYTEARRCLDELDKLDKELEGRG